MGIVDVASTLTHLPALLKLKKGMKPRPLDVNDCFSARVEALAENIGTNIAIIFEGKQVTWSELNQLANQYANYLASQGIQRGDVVSLMMENRIEFIALIIGINKLGATSGLINTNLRGRQLTHCITVTKSKKCIFGAELAEAFDDIRSELSFTQEDYLSVNDGEPTDFDWATNLSSAAATADSSNPASTGQVTLGDVALYIFTSGTTGLPKAAVLSNRRYLMSADLSAIAGLRATPKDRIYLCLPLYHGTGLMIGVGAAMCSGAGMFVRRKFSASKFLPEVREHNCTCFIYIGELCRYLTNTPELPDDANNPLRAMMGNGMRPDVWLGFKQRFGIKRVTEFYGSSEGNVAFANLMNKDQTVGMTSAQVALVQYDIHKDEVVRDNQGRCIEVMAGEPGLLLGKITEDTVFEGYTDAGATEKKILRGALEEGDAWFNTGDLMKVVDVGYTLGYDHYQFVDRVGDTFRWKSENVSTNEVGEIVNGFEDVNFCNIYGVEIPGADGRAGMAAINLAEGITDLNLNAFSEFVHRELPSYAIPVFLRIQRDIDVTGTFKMVKGDLREQAYNIDQFEDTVYVMKQGEQTYTLLEPDYLEVIRAGNAGY